MELYAAGFNAWNQLQFGKDEQTDEEPDDISSFTCVFTNDDGIEGVHPFPSHTTVHTKTSRILQAGLIPEDHIPLQALNNSSYSHFAQASNGLFIINDSYLFPSQPLLSAALPPPNWIRLSQVLPSDSPDIIQLVAYSTGFAALSAQGQVWTWGDERYVACLGRDLEIDATIPGQVTDLSDLPTGPITKLSAGGYVLAALTAGNDLYIWGHAGRAAAAGLAGLEVADEPMPVVIEDHDIADIAVGEAHLVALTTSGEVFVIGSNSNGQLGLGREVEAVDSWTKVSVEKQTAFVSVAAGPRSSFLLAKKDKQR